MQMLCRRTLVKPQKPEKTYKNHKISKGDGYSDKWFMKGPGVTVRTATFCKTDIENRTRSSNGFVEG